MQCTARGVSVCGVISLRCRGRVPLLADEITRFEGRMSNIKDVNAQFNEFFGVGDGVKPARKNSSVKAKDNTAPVVHGDKKQPSINRIKVD